MTTTAPVPPRTRSVSHAEYRAFVGIAMASAAVSIDLVLPAFARIRRDFDLPAGSAATAGLITAFFLGLACGPIPFGMISDRYGRRGVLRASCVLFIVGALAAAVAPSLLLIKVARFVWGLGAGGLRVTTTAMIRDRYEGADMAREMSFAMTVFLLVPVFAPLVGAGVVKVMPWRGAFVVCAVFAVGIALWSLRIPESLPADRRQPVSLRQFGVAAGVIGRNRKALMYTLATVPLFGVFSSYLASSERIVGDVFGRASWFPFVFGGSAVAMGAASLMAGRVVNRVGLEPLIARVFVAYVAACGVLLAVSLASDGRPGFWPYVAVLVVVLALLQVLFPNLNAAAMQPVGHVAGTAAAILATASTAGGALVGAVIDGAFDDTVNPFSVSFVLAAVVAGALVLVARAGGSRTPA